MSHVKLDSIAVRQRQYLVKDVLMASLAALILAIQVMVLSGANVPMAELRESAIEPALAHPGQAPNHVLTGDDDYAMTTGRAAVTPGT